MERPGVGPGADGAFERFLTAAIATIITIMFSWRLLEEEKQREGASKVPRVNNMLVVRPQTVLTQKPGPITGGEHNQNTNGTCNVDTEPSIKRHADQRCDTAKNQNVADDSLTREYSAENSEEDEEQPSWGNYNWEDDVYTPMHTRRSARDFISKYNGPVTSAADKVESDSVPVSQEMLEELYINREYREIAGNPGYERMDLSDSSSEDEGESDLPMVDSDEDVCGRAGLEPILEEDSDDLDGGESDDEDDVCRSQQSECEKIATSTPSDIKGAVEIPGEKPRNVNNETKTQLSEAETPHYRLFTPETVEEIGKELDILESKIDDFEDKIMEEEALSELDDIIDDFDEDVVDSNRSSPVRTCAIDDDENLSDESCSTCSSSASVLTVVSVKNDPSHVNLTENESINKFVHEKTRTLSTDQVNDDLIAFIHDIDNLSKDSINVKDDAFEENEEVISNPDRVTPPGDVTPENSFSIGADDTNLGPTSTFNDTGNESGETSNLNSEIVKETFNARLTERESDEIETNKGENLPQNKTSIEKIFDDDVQPREYNPYEDDFCDLMDYEDSSDEDSFFMVVGNQGHLRKLDTFENLDCVGVSPGQEEFRILTSSNDERSLVYSRTEEITTEEHFRYYVKERDNVTTVTSDSINEEIQLYIEECEPKSRNHSNIGNEVDSIEQLDERSRTGSENAYVDFELDEKTRTMNELNSAEKDIDYIDLREQSVDSTDCSSLAQEIHNLSPIVSAGIGDFSDDEHNRRESRVSFNQEISENGHVKPCQQDSISPEEGLDNPLTESTPQETKPSEVTNDSDSLIQESDRHVTTSAACAYVTPTATNINDNPSSTPKGSDTFVIPTTLNTHVTPSLINTHATRRVVNTQAVPSVANVILTTTDTHMTPSVTNVNVALTASDLHATPKLINTHATPSVSLAATDTLVISSSTNTHTTPTSINTHPNPTSLNTHMSPTHVILSDTCTHVTSSFTNTHATPSVTNTHAIPTALNTCTSPSSTWAEDHISDHSDTDKGVQLHIVEESSCVKEPVVYAGIDALRHGRDVNVESSKGIEHDLHATSHVTSSETRDSCDSGNKEIIYKTENCSGPQHESKISGNMRNEVCEVKDSHSEPGTLEDLKKSVLPCIERLSSVTEDQDDVSDSGSSENVERKLPDQGRYERNLNIWNNYLDSSNACKIDRSPVKTPSTFGVKAKLSKLPRRRTIPKAYTSILQQPITVEKGHHSVHSSPTQNVPISRHKIVVARQKFLSAENLTDSQMRDRFAQHKASLANAHIPTFTHAPSRQNRYQKREHATTKLGSRNSSLDRLNHISSYYNSRYSPDDSFEKPELDALHENCIFSPHKHAQLVDTAQSIDNLNPSNETLRRDLENLHLKDALRRYGSVASLETDIDTGETTETLYIFSETDLDSGFDLQNPLKRAFSMSELTSKTRKSSGRGRFADRNVPKSKSMQTLETNIDDVFTSNTESNLTRVPSVHELRVTKSLSKLNVPDWYKNSSISRSGSTFSLYGSQRRDSTSTTSSYGYPLSLTTSPCPSITPGGNPVVIKTRVTPISAKLLRTPKLPMTPEKSPISHTSISLPSDRYRNKEKPKGLMPIPIVPFSKLRLMFEKSTDSKENTKTVQGNISPVKSPVNSPSSSLPPPITTKNVSSEPAKKASMPPSILKKRGDAPKSPTSEFPTSITKVEKTVIDHIETITNGEVNGNSHDGANVSPTPSSPTHSGKKEASKQSEHNSKPVKSNKTSQEKPPVQPKPNALKMLMSRKSNVSSKSRKETTV